MVIARLLYLALCALIFAGATLPARALQLGETEAQVLARHGAPESRDRNVAVYSWKGWSAQLEFTDSVVEKLIYRRDAYLQAAEIEGLLRSNGGVGVWREMTVSRSAARLWVRQDGATATCAAKRPILMTFQATHETADAVNFAEPALPQLVVPGTADVVNAAPPKFPRLLGSETDNELAPRAKDVRDPAVPMLAIPRSLPKLQAQELTEPPVADDGRAEAVEAKEAPRTDAEADPVPETKTVTEQGSPADEHDWKLGWLTLLAVVIGGYYFLKKKPQPASAKASPIWTVDTTRPVVEKAPLASPALDALRTDQFELLVGEIFRREGYTVELSAAVRQDDSIDLTLRRDSETILVECRHWKMSRVTEQELRAFHTAMTACGAPRGVFATAGAFAKEAREFGESQGIELMDRAALEECTAAVARPGEDLFEITGWIEEFAANARIFDPECPICQGSMVIRHNRANGAASWTCRNHPRCPGKREPRLDLLTAATGR